jgi:hypothetical protein
VRYGYKHIDLDAVLPGFASTGCDGIAICSTEIIPIGTDGENYVPLLQHLDGSRVCMGDVMMCDSCGREMAHHNVDMTNPIQIPDA